MTNEPTFTSRGAVVLGHLAVTLPVLVMIVGSYFVGYALFGLLGALCSIVIGTTLAWLWWSAVVPRWREWAKDRGADPDQTQSLAQRTGLVWPKGHFLEKTEFRLRKRSDGT
jgi:hypothetical protein